MKILILGNSAGGTYNFRKELLQELIKRNHEVFLSVPNDDYVERIEALGCKVIITEFNRRGMNPKQEQILYKKYCKIIKEVKPDKSLLIRLNRISTAVSPQESSVFRSLRISRGWGLRSRTADCRQSLFFHYINSA